MRGQLRRRPHRWPPTGPPAGSGSCEAGHGPLADQFPLELGKGAEDVEDQPPSRGGGVHLFGEAQEGDLAVFQLADDVDEVLQRSAEAVESPDDDGVSRPGPVEQVVQGRPGLKLPLSRSTKSLDEAAKRLVQGMGAFS